MIDPAHQRRGVGKKLLETLTSQSDADGLPTALISSAEAYGLYKKLGFEDQGQFPIDNGHWAKLMTEHEKSLGITGNEGLGQKFEGMKEVENLMVRWPRKG